MTSTFRPLFGVAEMLWMPFLALIFEHFAAFPYGFAVGREEDGGVVDSADDGFREDVPGESWCVAFRREQKTK